LSLLRGERGHTAKLQCHNDLVMTDPQEAAVLFNVKLLFF